MKEQEKASHRPSLHGISLRKSIPEMGDATDWSAVLDALLKEVCEDEACKKLLDDLLGYAVYAVTKHEADIKDTLKNRIKAGRLTWAVNSRKSCSTLEVRRWPVDASGTLEVDVIWPGRTLRDSRSN